MSEYTIVCIEMMQQNCTFHERVTSCYPITSITRIEWNFCVHFLLLYLLVFELFSLYFSLWRASYSRPDNSPRGDKWDSKIWWRQAALLQSELLADSASHTYQHSVEDRQWLFPLSGLGQLVRVGYGEWPLSSDVLKLAVRTAVLHAWETLALRVASVLLEGLQVFRGRSQWPWI